MASNFYRGCPFCGRYGYNLNVKVYTDNETVWAECLDCGATGPKVPKLPDEYSASEINMARSAWNARGTQDRSWAKYLGGREAARNGKEKKQEGYK